jgi:hypothetical protein
MDETTQTQVDWSSTKLFVEFYGDIISLPIALFSSDILECSCAGPCLESRTVDKAYSMGLNNVVEVIVRRDVESTVAYLNYKRANVTLYVRYTSEGFNFGIRAPEYLAFRTSGVCVSGCERVVDQSGVECMRDEYIQPAVDICREVFADLLNYTSVDVDFDELRIKPCARDISQRYNATVALSHRYAYIDELLLSNFSTIIQRYPELTSQSFAANWTAQYDAVLESMARNCVEKAAPGAVNNNNNNKTGGRIAVGRMSIIDLSGLDVPKNNSDLLLFTPILAEPTDNSTTSTIHIDLSNDHFFDFSPLVTNLTGVSAADVDMNEWRLKCKQQRTTQLGNFYLPYTSNETLFVQCDESNRAFVKQCPFGTVFTVRMVCEPAVQQQLPLQRVSKLGDILTNGKAPLQIDLVRTSTTTTTTTTVVPVTDAAATVQQPPTSIPNPCTNESRAQGLFLFPHPTDAVQFILCDQANGMTIGQCMNGTRFSVTTRSCQKF